MCDAGDGVGFRRVEPRDLTAEDRASRDHGVQHAGKRDVDAERTALERVAAWALQFTPVVSLAPPAEVVLEIAGSVKLFGGFNRLLTRIENGLAELGYGVMLACSPTPLAAQLFARAALPARIRHHDALRQVVPVGQLDHHV